MGKVLPSSSQALFRLVDVDNDRPSDRHARQIIRQLGLQLILARFQLADIERNVLTGPVLAPCSL